MPELSGGTDWGTSLTSDTFRSTSGGTIFGDYGDSIVPHTPSGFTVTLAPDNVSVNLTIQTGLYNRFNDRQGRFSQARFYFTPGASEIPAGSVPRDTILSEFKSAATKQIAVIEVPFIGGTFTTTVNTTGLGFGGYWATLVNPASNFGVLESFPAGPVTLATDDYQRSLDYTIPDDVTNFTAGPVKIYSVPGTLLKYGSITFDYTRPAQSSFDGVSIWMNGYFSNQPGWPGTPGLYERCGYFKYRQDSGGYTFILQLDYDSSALDWRNIAHSVSVFCVSVSRGRTFKTPISTRPFVLFPNGIGG